ncbi:hypothetical protein FRB95_008016 [Tulasnella sp. JGI-2019a]|nr:hypothetical protein FRB95_008016 [Tulasnella sp. JGI-2019a]
MMSGGAPSRPYCAECGKKHHTSDAFLFQCRRCSLHFHHSTCLRHPLQPMSQEELRLRLRHHNENQAAKAQGKKPTAKPHLQDWECARCCQTGTEDDAIEIDDSDEEKDTGKQRASAVVVRQTERRALPVAARNISYTSQPVIILEESPELETISIASSPPPRPVPTRETTSYPLPSYPDPHGQPGVPPSSSLYWITLPPSSPTPEAPARTTSSRATVTQPVEIASPIVPQRRDAGAPLPPQDIAFRAQIGPVPQRQPQPLSTDLKDLPQPQIATVGGQPEDISDNLRSSSGTRSAQENATRELPTTITSHSTSRVEQYVTEQQLLTREETDFLDNFAHIKLDAGNEDGQDDYEDIDEVDMSQAGWPEGYVEPPLEYLDGDNVPMEKRRIKPWYPTRFPDTGMTSSSTVKRSRDNLFPRFDMFYEDFPNMGGFLGNDDAIPGKKNSGVRRARKVKAKRLDLEMTGPEVIYVAPRYGGSRR